MVYINTTGKHNEVWLDKPYATITVECPECPSTEDAYSSGYTDGSEEGYHKGYQSGSTDGWDAGYPSGYTDGVNSVICDDCQDFYDSGYTSGYDSGYTDGVNSVVCSGYTQEDLDNNWNSGYTSGYTDGLNACSGGNEDLIANLQGDYFIIPEGTTKLRDYAFYYAPISSITIPSSVTEIGVKAFSNTPLTGITIPSSIHTINESAFTSSRISEVTIPDTVSTLGAYVFHFCNYLTAATLPSGLTAIPNYLFSRCSLTGITLPTGITSIGVSAFETNPLTGNIVIPSGVTTIGSFAFYNCSGLTSMTFESPVPATITATSNATASLGSSAFTWPIYVPCEAVDTYKTAWPYYAHRIMCNSGSGVYLAGMYYVTSTTEPTQILTRNYGHDILLDKMEYPLGQSRETSNYFTFPATGMQTVYFYFKDPTTIPDKTFSGVTQLVGVNIPSVVNKIGDGAFRETSLTEVNVPSGVSLADYAFTRIPTLTAVTLGEGLSFSGGMECFSRTPITSITFPQSISAAPSHVLYNCSALTNVVFNGILERLDDAAFGNCIALRNYVIPSSVTFIGENCFAGIPNIGSITLLRTTPAPLDDNTTSLGYTTETFPIYVPAESVEAYKTEYLDYASRIQAIP